MAAGNIEGIRGRGASWNPANRFDHRHTVADPAYAGEDDTAPRPDTEVFEDQSKSIVTKNESPDVGMGYTLNPYRGCEHGCVYCFARPTHEYMGYSAGLDFETKIFAKHRAPALLRDFLLRPEWEARGILMSGVTDPYQPVEKELRLTRGCLEVFAEYRHPVTVLTKNRLVTRDIDVLRELARHQAVAVMMSITTLDLQLNRMLEPRSSSPMQRLDALCALRDAGIPTGIMVAPIIPAITDHEIPAILAAAADAGAVFAGRVMLRLPWAVAPIFEQWLAEHFPERKEKVLNRLRDMRGGKLNLSEFGARMWGTGPHADHIEAVFRIACEKEGLNKTPLAVSGAAFVRPGIDQLPLF